LYLIDLDPYTLYFFLIYIYKEDAQYKENKKSMKGEKMKGEKGRDREKKRKRKKKSKKDSIRKDGVG